MLALIPLLKFFQELARYTRDNCQYLVRGTIYFSEGIIIFANFIILCGLNELVSSLFAWQERKEPATGKVCVKMITYSVVLDQPRQKTESLHVESIGENNFPEFKFQFTEKITVRNCGAFLNNRRHIHVRQDGGRASVQVVKQTFASKV